MKILITGARGQLGHDCARILATENTVYGFGSRALDITDEARVSQLMKRVRPDTVINCAAYTAVDNCEKEQNLCRRVNTEGAAHLAEACAAINARLIHVSTDYVFDGNRDAPQPYVETDPVAPLSRYGRCKLAGEEAVRQRLDNHIILRTAWLYGISGNNFLKTMLRLAISDPERTIRVVHDQVGSLTWTHSLAHQIRVLLDSSLTGTIHATAEGHTTWYDGARFFLEAMAVPFSLEPCTTDQYPTPAPRPRNSILENRVLKNSRLNRMVSWQEDVQTFVDRYRTKLLAEAGGKG